MGPDRDEPASARRPTITIKAWLLPLIVIALVVPGTAGFLIAGPGLGLAVGALTVGVMIVVAVLIRPDEPIEVARAADERRRLLLVATDAVDRPAEVETLRFAASASPAGAEILVLAPALSTRLEYWATDVGRPRLDAQRKLVLTIGALAAAQLDARGAVGDPDPLQAVEDSLRDFAADEVFIAGADEDGQLLAELRRRLDLPVYRLAPSPPAHAAH